MPRSSKVHYIAPSAISILPNANGTSSDLAVYVARGTKIKVYSPAAGIDMEDTTYQEWSLRGRNRHLAEDSKPYTIYARLSKTMKEDGYLVFAPQKKNAVSGKWGDKYSSVTTEGLSLITKNDGTQGRVADPDYWYIRLGEVSLPDSNDKRTVDLDTGIVGTDQYNMDWALNPDNPELHVELDCKIDSKDAGPSPIVPLGKALVLTSLLKGKASIVDTLDHWEIVRSTGDDKSDASWPDASRATSFARTGIITLAHDKEEGDDFNGTVVAVFTVTAWGRPEEEAAGTRAGGTGTGTGTTEYVELASERISVMTQAGNQFLSRLVDDAAQGIITFMRGLKSVGDIIASVIKSDNYTGTGMADTGYLVTDNWNESGSSGAVFDYLTIRKKMIINSLEIKETHFSAGDLAQSCANAELARTDYYQVTVDGQDNETYTLLGYSEVRVPWVLRGIMAVRQKLFPGASKKVPSALGHWKKVRMTLTMEQLKKVNRVRCYFLAKDGERNVENWWRTNDLARCQTWNVEQSKRETFAPDFDNHMGNIYWWRKVMKVSQNTGEQRYVVKDSAGDPVPYDPKDINTYTTSPSSTKAWKNEVGNAHLATNGERSGRDTVPDDRKPAEIDGKTYHWFDVAYDYEREKDNKVHEWCDAMSDIPAAGDKVVQFGNTEDPDRMNVTVSEVNGSGNVDAPDIKTYRGIYSFSLQKSWWGGKPCKMKLSPSTGYELYGPHFRFITEYGKARPTMDRGLWTKIGFERDEYRDKESGYKAPDYSDDKKDASGGFVSRSDGVSPKNYVRKCYYYDRVSHKGSLWLCTMANELWYWRATETFTQDGTTYNAGDKLSDSQFTSLTDENRNKCEHVRNYTNEEPSATSLVWTKQVSQGGFKSRAFCRTNTDISTYIPEGGTPASPIPTKMKNPATGQYVSGITWYDGAPSADASGNKNAILWSTTAWFFDGDEKPEWSLPTPETDTQTQDIEFSPNREKPADPVGTAANKDTPAIKTQRHQQGWYDPKDTLPSGTTWEDMVWRAEHQIANGVYSGEWEISRIKGESANRLDLDNEMDMIQTSSACKITAERTVETVVHLYEGAGEVDLSSVSFGTSGDARISGGPAASVADFSQESEGTGKKGRRLKWKFKAGQVMNATYSIHITYKYLNVDYDGVLTVAASMGQPIYQLKPTANDLVFSRQPDNTLTPASRTLGMSVVKVDGTSSVEQTVAESGQTVRYSTSVMPTGATGGTAWGTSDGTSGITWSNNVMDVASSAAVSEIFVAMFSPSGVLLDRETIPIVKDGKNGSNGDTPLQAFKWTATDEAPERPTTGAFDKGWTATAPNRGANDKFLWMTQTVKRTAVNGSISYDEWSAPVRISGDKGDPGEDSANREWIYIGATTYSNPYSGTHPSSITRDNDGVERTTQYIHSHDDFVPQGWSDTAIAVDDTTNKYVYASWRDKAKGATTWGDFVDPILWSNWGHQGIDGDGVQYIYKLFDHELNDAERTSNIPTNAVFDDTTKEWMPQPENPPTVNNGWDDNPIAPTYTQPYCYCSVIKKLNGEWEKSGIYGSFGKLALWSVRAKNAVSADLDNQGDMIACNANGVVRFEQTISTRLRIYDGGQQVASGVSVIGEHDYSLAGQDPDSVYAEDGVLRVQWTFAAGTILTAPFTADIAAMYQDQAYRKTFTLTRMDSDAVYRVGPFPSVVSFTIDASGELTPASRTLEFHLSRRTENAGQQWIYQNGSGITTADGITLYPYYRLCVDGAWNNMWTRWAGSMVIQSGTNISDIEICISTADGESTAVTDANIFDREVIPVVKDGAKGDDGDSPVVYTIECSDAIKPGDTYLNPVEIKRSEGSTTEIKRLDAARRDWHVYLTSSLSWAGAWPDGDIVDDEDGESQLLFNIQGHEVNIGSNTQITLMLRVGSRESQEIVAKKVIRGVTDGDGKPGHVGRWYYYAGEWDAQTTYYFEATRAPYVSRGGTFYMLDCAAWPETQQSSSTRPSWDEDPADPDFHEGNPWSEMQSTFKYIITEAIFSGFAHLGSFIINGDWMISQYGTSRGGFSDGYVLFDPAYPQGSGPDVYHNVNGNEWVGASFAPNFAVDGKTGKVYMNDAYVRGQIVATGGEIDGQMIVGNSGLNHIKIQPMDGYGAAVEGYAGDDKKFSLGFFGGNPCLYVGDSFYGERTVKLTDSTGSYAQLIMGYGGIPQVMLYHKESDKKIIIDLDSQGVARIIADSWPTGRNSVGVGGVYMEPSSRVLMVRDS